MKFNVVGTTIEDLGNIEDIPLSTICKNVYQLTGDLDNETDFRHFLEIFDCSYLDDFNDLYDCDVQKPSDLIELLKSYKTIVDIAKDRIICLYLDGQFIIKKTKLTFSNIPNLPDGTPSYGGNIVGQVRDGVIDTIITLQGKTRNIELDLSDRLETDQEANPQCGVTPAGCDLAAEGIERYMLEGVNVDRIMQQSNDITLRKIKEIFVRPYTAIDTLQIKEDCCAYGLLHGLYKESLTDFVARKGYRCCGDFYEDCPDQIAESHYGSFLDNCEYIELPETLQPGGINEGLRG